MEEGFFFFFLSFIDILTHCTESLGQELYEFLRGEIIVRYTGYTGLGRQDNMGPLTSGMGSGMRGLRGRGKGKLFRKAGDLQN